MADEERTRWYRYEHPDDLDDPLAEFPPVSMRDGEVHVPTLARKVLEELLLLGLSHVKDTEPPENIRRVTVGERQEVWLRFDTYRDDEGYMALDVVDAPRSDAAILAAMMAFLMKPVERERINRAVAFRFSEAYADLKKQSNEPWEERQEGQGFYLQDLDLQDLDIEQILSTAKNAAVLLRNAQQLLPLHFVFSLISYYRPEIQRYSGQDSYEHALKATDHINDFLRSLRNLQNFLEYGVVDQKRLTPAIKHPQRDVRAAVLHEVDGLSYPAIGEHMGLPDPPNIDIKKDHPTVRKMVATGRLVLEGAFGKEGWQDRVRAMKAEKARWQSLSPADQEKEHEVERYALEWGIPLEEARRQIGRDDS